MYSTHVYADKASKVIAEFAAEEEASRKRESDPAASGNKSLFMYLAFQAIHSPDEAPNSYVTPFETMIPDVQVLIPRVTYKGSQ